MQILIIAIKHTHKDTDSCWHHKKKETHNQPLTTLLKVDNTSSWINWSPLSYRQTKLNLSYLWMHNLCSYQSMSRAGVVDAAVTCWIAWVREVSVSTSICMRFDERADVFWKKSTHTLTHRQTLRHWGSNCVHLLLFIG